MSNLKGKVALVTGASKGIGAGVARELGKCGAAVAINYSKDKTAAEKVVKQIEAAGGKAVAIKANVGDPSSAEPLAEAVAMQLGPIDILVNNAGIYEFAPLGQITEEHFRKLFDVNVLGLMMVTQAAVKRFNSAGGSIINIGSNVARTGNPMMLVYGATKGAVNVVTGALAKQLGPQNIRVNALNPGMVETDGAHAIGAVGSDFQKNIEKGTPLGRIAQPMDIGQVAAFLASSDSGWINGQTIYVDGGFVS
jgi:3-oxoacyl-[acyl-carrier protein] reductase